MENLPQWAQIVIFVIGSNGVIWVFWSKFGEAIKNTLNIKNDIKSGSLKNKSQEIDIMKQYDAFFEQRMEKLLENYSSLETKFSMYREKMNNQMEVDKRMLSKQNRYITYLKRNLRSNHIEYKSFEDEEFN